MSSFLEAIFGGQISQIIQKNKYVDVRVGSTSLTKQLSSKKGQDILAKYLKAPQTEHRYLRILTLLGLTLLYSDECYEVVSEHLKAKCFTDTWISYQVLMPLARWVKKCCQTSQLFKLVKKNFLDISTVMDRLPYTINLLREIVKIINSLPKFGRYYNLKEQHKEYMMLSEVVMALNNLLYSHMKTNLQHFMSNGTKENVFRHKEIIKWIFNEVLPEINEKIRFVTLSRHFDLYCKGIVTKLIESDLYDPKVQGLLSQISIQQRSKAKSLHYQQLATQIFPGDGSFDEGLYLSTLQETRKFNKINDIKLLLNSSTSNNRWAARIRPKTKRF